MMHSRRLPLVVALVGLVAAACDGAATTREARPRQEAGFVVDSALAIDTLLARFRATVSDTPATLAGGEASAERVARAYLLALSSHDTATVRRLLVSRAEFAWLYYPHTRFTKAPYELGPELLWMQLRESSEKGVVRALRRLGGSALRFEALTCPDTAVIEGPNRVLAGCTVRFAPSDSTARTMRLFGSLLERDGRWKIISYANDL